MSVVEPIELSAPPKVMGDDEQFHATDEAVDLSRTPLEGWVALGIFWALGVTVFYQFFTRYVLNNSASWTEEIARYLLISMVFVGVSAAVRTSRHIHVDLVYRLIPRRTGRVLSTFVDAVKIAFFSFAAVLTWQMMEKMTNYKMTIIDLPMNLVYGVCMLGFALAALRSVQVAVLNWRRGYSALERPDLADEIAR